MRFPFHETSLILHINLVYENWKMQICEESFQYDTEENSSRPTQNPLIYFTLQGSMQPKFGHPDQTSDIYSCLDKIFFFCTGKEILQLL